MEPVPSVPRRSLVRVAIPLLALSAVARLATLDDADAATNLLTGVSSWAWVAGILLIVVDIVLPVPQPLVITVAYHSLGRDDWRYKLADELHSIGVQVDHPI
jgi:hypothetical protein